MIAKQAHAVGYGTHLTSANTGGTAQKKKASWARTILWMLSMALLGNVIMAIVAYILFF